MSVHAKSIIAAFGAVVFVAITAWQQATAGGFRWVDLIPVAVVVVGAIQTRVIPNVPELPWAKAVVGCSAAVLSALATLVASDPSGVTAGKLLTVASSAFLVWFVPELGPELAPLGPDGTPSITSLAHPAGQEITDALAALDRPPTPAPVLAPQAAPEPLTRPLPPVALVPAAPVEPTPIGDAAATAARALSTDTVTLPAASAAPAA